MLNVLIIFGAIIVIVIVIYFIISVFKMKKYKINNNAKIDLVKSKWYIFFMIIDIVIIVGVITTIISSNEYKLILTLAMCSMFFNDIFHESIVLSGSKSMLIMNKIVNYEDIEEIYCKNGYVILTGKFKKKSIIIRGSEKYKKNIEDIINRNGT